jgi:hypothetical protein
MAGMGDEREMALAHVSDIGVADCQNRDFGLHHALEMVSRPVSFSSFCECGLF